MKAQLILHAIIALVSNDAFASDCNDPARKQLAGSVTSTEIKDREGRTERYFVDHYGQDCRIDKREILDARSQVMAYEVFIYDDARKNSKTGHAERSSEVYSPDGTLLFRNLPDGRTVDAAGKTIPDCELPKLAQFLPREWRPVEAGCDDAS